MINLSEITQVVVVTYNPEIELFEKNIKALHAQFEHILIVDNNSKNIAGIEKLLSDFKYFVKIVKLDNNMGIAYAQNLGLKLATEKGMKWLLTMDQDSIIPDNLTTKYMSMINQDKNVAMIGWGLKNGEVYGLLSSGCIANVKMANKIGGFNEELFIYHVDTDFTLRMKRLGKTLATDSVCLAHQLGETTNKKTLTGKEYREHSLSAHYYITRNSAYLFKKYFFIYPFPAIRIFILAPLYEIFNLLVHTQKRAFAIKLFAAAISAGLKNNLGKYQS